MKNDGETFNNISRIEFSAMDKFVDSITEKRK